MVNKTILIISPQAWGDMMLSKHHYAQYLSTNNNVIFLEPPSKQKMAFSLTEVDNIKVVSFNDFGIRKLRRRVDFLYNILLDSLLKRVLNCLKLTDIDLVLNFDNGIYYRPISYLSNVQMVFFPVDNIVDDKLKSMSFDRVTSISSEILDSCISNSKLLIEHGLADCYEKLSLSKLDDLERYRESLIRQSYSQFRVSYIGNLLATSVDRESIFKIIKSNPRIRFDFYGNTLSSVRINSGNNVNSEDKNFISRLESFDNVFLHGVLEPIKLSEALQETNVFILLYKESSGYKMDNSHKILEYLSYGVPIISSPILKYLNSELLYIIKNENASIVLSDIFNNYEEYISLDCLYDRISYSINFTYKNNVEKILSFNKALDN